MGYYHYHRRYHRLLLHHQRCTYTSYVRQQHAILASPVRL